MVGSCLRIPPSPMIARSSIGNKLDSPSTAMSWLPTPTNRTEPPVDCLIARIKAAPRRSPDSSHATSIIVRVRDRVAASPIIYSLLDQTGPCTRSWGFHAHFGCNERSRNFECLLLFPCRALKSGDLSEEFSFALSRRSNDIHTGGHVPHNASLRPNPGAAANPKMSSQAGLAPNLNEILKDGRTRNGGLGYDNATPAEDNV